MKFLSRFATADLAVGLSTLGRDSPGPCAGPTSGARPHRRRERRQDHHPWHVWGRGLSALSNFSWFRLLTVGECDTMRVVLAREGAGGMADSQGSGSQKTASLGQRADCSPHPLPRCRVRAGDARRRHGLPRRGADRLPHRGALSHMGLLGPTSEHGQPVDQRLTRLNRPVSGHG
jgi:hypothetical protein